VPESVVPGEAEATGGPTSVDHDRSARLMTALVGASRASGLARMLVAFAVLGTSSPLSNVYTSANTVPTLLFEMLAAGALSATLVPEFRRRHAAGDHRGGDRLAASVLVWGGAALGAVLAVALLARHALSDLLLVGIDDPAERSRAASLLSLLLLFLLPQVLAYLVNAVAVAHLQARFRFGASMICPLVNNLVLIATYLLFWRLRDGRPPGLDLSDAEVATLGLGTLGGVIAMCAVPAVDAVRSGWRPARPFPARSPEVRRLLRDGVWAAVFLAGGQAVLALALPLTNAHDGHGVVWQLAWQLFLLPHALLAVPVLTARFPAMAAAHDRGDGVELAGVTGGGIRSVVATGALAGAILWAAAEPVGRILAVGAASRSAPLLEAALVTLAPGIAVFGVLHLLTRRCYAIGDTRTPALAALVVLGVAAAIMFGVVGQVAVERRLSVLGAAVTLGNLAGVVVLARRVRLGGLARPVLRRLAAATTAGVVGRGAVAAVGGVGPGRPGAVGSVLLAGLAGVGAYLLVDRGAGGPGWRRTLATMGAGERSA